MKNPFNPCVGTVMSADIAVPDHAAEVRFYAQILSTGSPALWREDLMNSAGLPIIGLGERTAAYADLPVQWMPHLQVEDVAASAQRALDRGAEELLHGRDDDGNSQWAVLRDPFGASFGLIPVVDATPGPDAATSGHIDRVELVVSDQSRARDFYRSVGGWTEADSSVNADASEVQLLRADGAVAGILTAASGLAAALPTVWLLHLPVADLDASLERVHAEGGSVLRTTERADGTITSAVVRDLVGAYVVLVRG